MAFNSQRTDNKIRQSFKPFSWAFIGGMTMLILFMGIYSVNVNLVPPIKMSLQSTEGKAYNFDIKDIFAAKSALDKNAAANAKFIQYGSLKFPIEKFEQPINRHIYGLYGLMFMYFLLFFSINIGLFYFRYKKKYNAKRRYKREVSYKTIFKKYKKPLFIFSFLLTLPVMYFIYTHSIVIPKEPIKNLAKQDIGAFVLFSFAGGVYGLIITIIAIFNQEDAKGEVIRGKELITQEEYAEIQKETNVEGIQLTETIKLDQSTENEHIMIIGQPGVGKTAVGFNRIINQKLVDPNNKNAKFIINEIKIGTFTSDFYNPNTDYFYDPGLKGSIVINPFDYIKDIEDLSSIAAALLQEVAEDQKSPGWLTMASSLLAADIVIAQSKGDTSAAGILKAASLPAEEMLAELKKITAHDKDGKVLEDKPIIADAITYLSSGDQQVGIYLSVFKSKMVYFKNLREDPTQIPLNLEEWVDRPGQSKIFMLTRMKNKKAAAVRNATVIQVLFDIIFTKQNKVEDKNKKYYFILDELGNLGTIPFLETAQSLGRSYGICVISSVQSLGQLYVNYGKELAKTILDSTGTYFIFRAKDSAKELSELIGTMEVIEYTEGESYGVEANKGGGSTNKSAPTTKQVVTDGEIKNLPKFHYFLYQPNIQHWTLVEQDNPFDRKQLLPYDININPYGEFKMPEKSDSLIVEFTYEGDTPAAESSESENYL